MVAVQLDKTKRQLKVSGGININENDIKCIKDISTPQSSTKCKWKHHFRIKTSKKEYKFFAVTEEERDLWVESLFIYLNAIIFKADNTVDVDFIPIRTKFT